VKELSKVDIVLIALAVAVMVAIYFIYPHTWLGEQSYAEQRQNAITYINAVRFETGEGYQKEIQRLIKKYHLEDIYSEELSPFEVLLNENR